MCMFEIVPASSTAIVRISVLEYFIEYSNLFPGPVEICGGVSDHSAINSETVTDVSVINT